MSNIITPDTPVSYENETIRERAQHLVEREVLYCVSSLVDSLAKATAERDIDGLTQDDVMSVCVSDDWETPAREHIDGLDVETLQDLAEYLDSDILETMGDSLTRDGLELAIVAHCEDDTDQWRELCDYCRVDPDTVEAYEHWIVSEWFAGQLESEGEMVSRDILGLTVWGRRTTGQSIGMDYVILKIARDNIAR